MNSVNCYREMSALESKCTMVSTLTYSSSSSAASSPPETHKFGVWFILFPCCKNKHLYYGTSYETFRKMSCKGVFHLNSYSLGVFWVSKLTNFYICSQLTNTILNVS